MTNDTHNLVNSINTILSEPETPENLYTNNFNNPFWVRGAKPNNEGKKVRYCTTIENHKNKGYEIFEISPELFKEYYNLSSKSFDFKNLEPYKGSIFFSKNKSNLNLLIDRRNPVYNRNNKEFYLCPEGNTDALALVSFGFDKDYGILKRFNLTSLPSLPENAKTVLFIRDKEETKEQLTDRILRKYTDLELSKVKFLTIGSEYFGSQDISDFLENSVIDTNEEILKVIIKNSKELALNRPITLNNLVEDLINKTNSDKRKSIKSSLVTLMLEALFEWRKNEITNFTEVRLNTILWLTIEFDRKTHWSDKLPMEYLQLSEEIVNSIELFISESLELIYNKAVNIEKIVNKCINSLSKKRIYNPIKDYFNSLEPIEPTDLYHPVKELFACLTLHPDYKKYEFDIIAILSTWLGMAVKCVLEEFPNELMPILTGEQGAGKTKFMRALVPEVLKDYVSNRIERSKDGNITMTRNLLVIDDELDNLKRASIEQLKDRLSSVYMTFRPPYGKYDLTAKRTASLIGATNNIDFLSDHTGNRRFFPIPVIKCENEIQHYKNMQKLMNFDTNTLWALGLYLYQNQKNLFINEEQLKRINEINSDFSVIDVYEQAVLQYLIPPEMTDKSNSNFMTPKMILEKFIEKSSVSTFSNDRYGSTNLGKALNKLGYERKSKRANKSHPEYGYYILFKDSL